MLIDESHFRRKKPKLASRSDIIYTVTPNQNYIHAAYGNSSAKVCLGVNETFLSKECRRRGNCKCLFSSLKYHCSFANQFQLSREGLHRTTKESRLFAKIL